MRILRSGTIPMWPLGEQAGGERRSGGGIILIRRFRKSSQTVIIHGNGMHYALESRDMAKTERGLVMSTIVEAATPLAAGGRMTVDEFDRIDESLDGPFELIDGQLIESRTWIRLTYGLQSGCGSGLSACSRGLYGPRR